MNREDSAGFDLFDEVTEDDRFGFRVGFGARVAASASFGLPIEFHVAVDVDASGVCSGFGGVAIGIGDWDEVDGEVFEFELLRKDIVHEPFGEGN